jgi:hypothetical protein
MPLSPKHTRIDRDEYSYVGNVNHGGVFIRSGSITSVTGGTTGSVSFTLDAVAARVKRVFIFLWKIGRPIQAQILIPEI